MLIAVDFDGTLVSQGRAYSDVTTPLQLLPGAKDGLLALRRAGHALLLWSGRASAALRLDPSLSPWVRSGYRQLDRERWERDRAVHEARYQQMLAFVEAELPDLFDAIDDGTGGKPDCDLFIDDKALRLGHGATALTWGDIAHVYGEPVYREE